MTTVLGCIADDFTGAADLAGLLARSGARVSLRIGVPDDVPADPAPFEVIALKTRTAPRAEAVEQALAAQDWLARAGARRFFWKYCSTFDSTPAGNIGPVAEALMARLGTDRTIYCPAFPENGRTVFMGHLFVGRQLLSESPMKDHPLTPMRGSDLTRLLAPQVGGAVGLVDRHGVARGPGAVRAAVDALAEDGTGHVVVDAVADGDLEVIARACRDLPLLTGGSALAMPLPALCAEDGLVDLGAARPRRSVPPARSVLLSGSCSAMTNAQVARYRAAGAPTFRLSPLDLAEGGTGRALDWLAAQDLGRAPLIHATAEPAEVRAAQDRLGAVRAGEMVEAALAACAVAARDAGARRLVVAGGETSGAVTQALGVRALDIGAEIAPGVPWTFCESGGYAIALALKSGNFGAETFFSDALAALEAT